MKLTATKRMGRVEIKSAGALQTLAEEQRKRKAEAREQWRIKNTERLRWEMFLRNHGPDSMYMNQTPEDLVKYPDEAEEIEAAIACRKLCQPALKKYKGHIVDYKAMNDTEKAFACLLEDFNTFIDTDFLFGEDLDRWSDKLGLDESRPPFDDLIAAIDDHVGNSDWREIYRLQEAQDDMVEQARETYEDLRERYLRYKAEHPEDFQSLS